MKQLSLVLAVLMLSTSTGVLVEPCAGGLLHDSCDLAGSIAHDLAAQDLHLEQEPPGHHTAPEGVPVAWCSCLCHVQGLLAPFRISPPVQPVTAALEPDPSPVPDETPRLLFRPPRLS